MQQHILAAAVAKLQQILYATSAKAPRSGANDAAEE